MSDTAPYEHLTLTPLSTYDSNGVRATLSTRSDGWTSYVVGQHPHWCEAGAERTRKDAVDAVERAIRQRGIKSPVGNPAGIDAGASHA